MKTSKYTPEQKQAWKEERIAEQKQMLQDALETLSSSETWQNWVKFGRSNLAKYSFNNALLIFAQKQEAKRVAGRKQWEKQGVNVNEDAKALGIFAPCFGIEKDEQGRVVLDSNGQPKKRVLFFKVVQVFDVTDTDAPESDFNPMVPVEGEELMDHLAPLEQFARELGYAVEYIEETGNALGWVDERNWKIVLQRNQSGNALVRTLVHELAHAYGNVNYQDYSREDAEVIVESSTVMTLSMLGFDVSNASVPYIADWGGDLTVLDKYAKLVEELVKTLTDKMGV